MEARTQHSATSLHSLCSSSHRPARLRGRSVNTGAGAVRARFGICCSSEKEETHDLTLASGPSKRTGFAQIFKCGYRAITHTHAHTETGAVRTHTCCDAFTHGRTFAHTHPPLHIHTHTHTPASRSSVPAYATSHLWAFN